MLIKNVNRLIASILVASTFITTSSCTKNEEEIRSNLNYHKIWMAPLPMNITEDRHILADFTEVVTNPEQYYPDVQKHTSVFKTYIEAFMRYTPEEVQQLADYSNKYNMEVAVEVGGIRTGVGHVPNNKIGIESAKFEYLFIKKFIDAGGKVNFITTDHSMADYLTGAKNDLADMTMEEIMGQQMEYFQYMQEQIEGLKVGTIESLGYFWVEASNKQYTATVASLARLDFDVFFDTYLSVAKNYDVTLDHFHIDFGAHDATYDEGFGRILTCENYIMSKNIDSGFIATNAFHIGNDKWSSSDPKSASISASKRALIFFEEYVKAGGKSNYLILQRWQPFPIEIGSQEDTYTQLGLFNSILTSKYFPQQ